MASDLRGLMLLSFCVLVGCSEDDSSSSSSKSDDDGPEASSEEEASSQGDHATSGTGTGSDGAASADGSGGGTGAGVALLRPETAGLCRLDGPSGDKNACWDYQPREVGSLAPGSYVLHARLSVARDLEVPVTFDTHCRRAGSQGDRKHRSQTVDVRRGSQEEGYRVRYLPLAVPEDTWASDCTWSLSAPAAYGGELASGSWSFDVP